MARETREEARKRWAKLELLRSAYPTFRPFAEDVMRELGFTITRIQKDIAEFMEFGPHYAMIQAQRGEAKTTLVAAFAVWRLIHTPSLAVLILSAGGTLANEISTMVVRIIMRVDELACMRPDTGAGDKASVEAFDVHYTLKGHIQKSPSVACIGITGNLQGKRAGLLIADDIESAKNSMTEHQRQQLIQLTRDFPSICATGRIIYIGTPQSINSVYNTLPGRGYAVRIWPGRYPTTKQMENYGDMLAPLVKRDIENNPSLQIGGGFLGDQGQPLDPDLPAGQEEELQKKERDQGSSYFQLQHMLNTKLADADRYPLHLYKIQVSRVAGDMFPLAITPGLLDHQKIKYELNGTTYTLAVPTAVSPDVAKLQGIVMYTDPAGGGRNGDETAYAIVGFLNGNMWVLECSGIPGGYSPDGFKFLTSRAAHWKVNCIKVEKNLGNGAFLNAWLPYLRAGYPQIVGGGCAIEEDWASGQKEVRIIDTLEPVIGRGSLVFNDDIARDEPSSLAGYPADMRATYSLFHQIARITREKGALMHDDRLDALSGAVRYWVDKLGVDQMKAVQAQRVREHEAWVKNPLNRPAYGRPQQHRTLFDKYRR